MQLLYTALNLNNDYYHKGSQVCGPCILVCTGPLGSGLRA